MPIDNLKDFAKEKGIEIRKQGEIVQEAIQNIKNIHNYPIQDIKKYFDDLISECESEAYKLYLKSEKDYGSKVLTELIKYTYSKNHCKDFSELGYYIGEHFLLLDRFFLSLSQSRKARAGKTFEIIHNTLFKILSYPFSEQAVINGKPDFIMPSIEYYKRNPLGCIVFTAKRTLRERWRQIVTEGTRGIGFYLATIDEKLTSNQLHEMLEHKIFVVVPKDIKERKYDSTDNVLSFLNFFEDHLDPKVRIWKREGII